MSSSETPEKRRGSAADNFRRYRDPSEPKKKYIERNEEIPNQLELNEDHTDTFHEEVLSTSTADFDDDPSQKNVTYEEPQEHNDDTTIEALSDLLMVEMQKDNIQDVIQALCQFAHNLLASAKEEYAKEALILGGHTVVFLAMKKWEASEPLQRAGCSCILLLSRHMRNTIVAAGGIEVVLRAIQLYPHSKLVQRSGCSAVSSFYVQFQSAPLSVAKKLHQHVQTLVEKVVQAMNTFPNEPDLQDIGCRFLCNLSRSQVFVDVLLRSRAMSAVTAAMERNPNNEVILLCTKKLTAAVLA